MTTQHANGLAFIEEVTMPKKNVFLDAFVNTALLNHSWPFKVNEKQCSILDRDQNEIAFTSTAAEAHDLLDFIVSYREASMDPAIVEETEKEIEETVS